MRECPSRRQLCQQRFDKCRLGRLALQPRRQVGEQLEIVESLLGAAENLGQRTGAAVA